MTIEHRRKEKKELVIPLPQSSKKKKISREPKIRLEIIKEGR